MGTMLPFNALAIGVSGSPGGGGTPPPSSIYAGPVIVAGSALGGYSNSSSIAVPVPSGTTVGQLVLIYVSVEYNLGNTIVAEQAVTPPAGFTLAMSTQQQQSGASYLEVTSLYYGYTTISSGTWTFTINSVSSVAPDAIIASALVIAGSSLYGNPFTGTATSGGGAAGGAMTAGSLTPANDNALLLANSYISGSSSFSLPSAWTSYNTTANGVTSSIAYLTMAASAATGSIISTASDTADAGTLLVSAITTGNDSGAGKGTPVVAMFAGGTGSGYANGTGLAAKFNGTTTGISLVGVATDLASNVYVADPGNNGIRKITSAGAVTLLSGSTSQASGLTEGSSTASRYHTPVAAAVSRDGTTIYIADNANNAIRSVTTSGTSTLLASGITTPWGVAVDWAGNILAINGTGFYSITPSGTVTSLSPDDTSDLGYIANLTVDISGNYYFADSGNGHIHKVAYDLSTTTNYPTGSTAIYDVAVDAMGNMYAAGAGNTIIKVTSAGATSTYAGSGTNGYLNGIAGNAQFNSPGTLAFDGAMNLYVGESSAVRVIHPSIPIGAFAAPAFVASTSASNVTGTATSITGTLPTNSSGYIAYFMPATNGDPFVANVVPPIGWTAVYNRAIEGVASNSDIFYVYVATSSNPGTTWSWTGSAWAALMIDGYDQPITVVNSGAAYLSSVTPTIAAPPTTTVVRAYMDENLATSGTVTVTYPSGTSNQHSNNALISGTGTMIIATASAASPSSYGATSTGTFSVSTGSDEPHSLTLVIASTAISAPAIASYNFNDGSGTTVTDVSGNGHAITLNNSAAWNTSGHSGSGFDGGEDNDYQGTFTLGTGSITNWTAMFWIYIKDANATQWTGIWDDGTTAPDVTLSTGSIIQIFADLNTGVLSTGTWYHIAHTVTSGGTCSVYVNGALVGTSTGTYTLNLANTFTLGKANDVNYAAHAIVDDLRFFSVALTAAQITKYMNAPVQSND